MTGWRVGAVPSAARQTIPQCDPFDDVSGHAFVHDAGADLERVDRRAVVVRVQNRRVRSNLRRFTADLFALGRNTGPPSIGAANTSLRSDQTVSVDTRMLDDGVESRGRVVQVLHLALENRRYSAAVDKLAMEKSTRPQTTLETGPGEVARHQFETAQAAVLNAGVHVHQLTSVGLDVGSVRNRWWGARNDSAIRLPARPNASLIAGSRHVAVHQCVIVVAGVCHDRIIVPGVVDEVDIPVFGGRRFTAVDVTARGSGG